MRWIEILLFIVGCSIMILTHYYDYKFSNGQVIATVIFCTVIILMKIPNFEKIRKNLLVALENIKNLDLFKKKKENE